MFFSVTSKSFIYMIFQKLEFPSKVIKFLIIFPFLIKFDVCDEQKILHRLMCLEFKPFYFLISDKALKNHSF